MSKLTAFIIAALAFALGLFAGVLAMSPQVEEYKKEKNQAEAALKDVTKKAKIALEQEVKKAESAQKWATQKEQCRNTRRNHMIEFDGQLLCLTEWSERFGYGDPAGLWYALVRGATMEEIALRRGYYG